MRAKSGLNLRDVCGEHVLVAEGKENIDFSDIISMNETSAYLWEKIQDKEFDAETLATLIVEAFDIDFDTALADSKGLIKQWERCGILE